MKRMQRHPVRVTGFTLMEVLVTVVIVGILASVAIPNYTKTLEQGYRREAQDLLLTIFYGERAYLAENGGYFLVDNPDDTGQWRTLFMENPNLASIPVTFTITSVCNQPDCDPPEFTAEAERRDDGLDSPRPNYRCGRIHEIPQEKQERHIQKGVAKVFF